MAAQGETEGKRLTIKPRKTLVKNSKLSTMQPRPAVIGVAGHTNERSLANYEEGDENEQRLISSVIRRDGQASTSNQHRPLQNVSLSSAVKNTLMMTE